MVATLSCRPSYKFFSFLFSPGKICKYIVEAKKISGDKKYSIYEVTHNLPAISKDELLESLSYDSIISQFKETSNSFDFFSNFLFGDEIILEIYDFRYFCDAHYDVYSKDKKLSFRSDVERIRVNLSFFDLNSYFYDFLAPHLKKISEFINSNYNFSRDTYIEKHSVSNGFLEYLTEPPYGFQRYLNCFMNFYLDISIPVLNSYLYRNIRNANI